MTTVFDPVAPTAPPAQGKPETPWQRFASNFRESRVAVIALYALIVILAAAVLAPLISPQDPYDLTRLNLLDAREPPGTKALSGDMTYWLGSDSQGRDMLSAIVYGLRISLGVGVISGLIAVCIGMCLGLVAGYAGGRVDMIIMRIVDLQLSFPSILVALMLLAILGQGVDKIIIALVIVQWAYYTRTVRASALAERRREYIEASRCLALSRLRIIFQPPAAQLHAAADRRGHRAGGPRHLPGGDPVLSRPRPAADGALPGAAHRQRVRLHHERTLLDQLLSR